MGDESSNKRISLNVRVDSDKHMLLEKMRITGWGLAQTERNRSDVYNEILGYGLQTHILKVEIGDRDFERLWALINKINWQKLSIEKIEKFLAPT